MLKYLGGQECDVGIFEDRDHLWIVSLCRFNFFLQFRGSSICTIEKHWLHLLPNISIDVVNISLGSLAFFDQVWGLDIEHQFLNNIEFRRFTLFLLCLFSFSKDVFLEFLDSVFQKVRAFNTFENRLAEPRNSDVETFKFMFIIFWNVFILKTSKLSCVRVEKHLHFIKFLISLLFYYHFTCLNIKDYRFFMFKAHIN